MNRGTALKWISEIESGRYKFGNGGLRYTVGQDDFYDPFGVLLNFLNSNGWQSHPIFGYSFEGEVCKMPEKYRKQCKMKTIWGDFVAEDGHQDTLVDVTDSSTSWVRPLRIIKDYYEQL